MSDDGPTFDGGTTREVAKATGEVAKLGQKSIGLLEKLLGPAMGPAEELGGLVKDHFAFVRQRQTIRREALLEETRRQLEARNVEAVPVRETVLLPLLEGGSLEDDPDMAKRWATLLATAADPATAHDVPPSFPAILAELSPAEARILDIIRRTAPHGETGYTVHFWVIRKELGAVDDRTYDVAVDNLFRLQLCCPPRSKLPFGPLADESLPPEVRSPFFLQNTKQSLGLTDLGVAFLKACTPPPNEDATT